LLLLLERPRPTRTQGLYKIARAFGTHRSSRRTAGAARTDPVIRSSSTPTRSNATATSMSSPSTRSIRRRQLHTHHRAQPRAGSRPRACAAAALVSQHVSWAIHSQTRADLDGDVVAADSEHWACTGCIGRRTPRGCSRRTRPTVAGCSDHRSRVATFKDAFHDHVVAGLARATTPHHGTKAAAHYRLEIPANGHASVRLRLSSGTHDAIRLPISPLTTDDREATTSTSALSEKH